ncbi:MAG: ribonuclease III [Bdellovibrionales bacterium]
MTTLERKLGYRFINQNLLNRALTHKSYHNENTTDSLGNNERLEFLGDAVLGLIISDQLMRQMPEVSEGDLSRIRASLVNESILAELALGLDIQNEMLLGKGELRTGGQDKPRLLASCLEAVIGALYVDGGFEPAKDVISGLYSSRLDNVDVHSQFSQDYKTRLQERIQEHYKQTPVYEVVNESGPDHDKQFVVEVRIDEKTLGRGNGSSKKQAAQEAARLALEGL